MFIGIESACLGKNIFEQIQRVSRYGFDEIEINTNPSPYLRGIWARDALMLVNLKKLKKLLKKFKRIDLHAPYQYEFDVSLVSIHPLIRELSLKETELAIKLCGELNGRIATFHSGYSSQKWEDVKDEFTSTLARLNRVAGKFGVKLGLEVGEYFLDLKRFKMLNEFENIGITLDLGHINFNYNGKPACSVYGNIEGFIRKFRDKILHVHVHDFDGRKDHLGLGKGKTDFKGIINCLKETGYRDSLCFELNPAFLSRTEILRNKRSLEKLCWGKNVI